ncbi:MAG: methyl-accepting chemotaxis protein [Pseudomonadota bacterium]
MNQSLARKQITILLVVGLIPMLVVSLLASHMAQKELESQSYGQLESIREMKSKSVQRYFSVIKEQLLDMSGQREIANAMAAFNRSFVSMGERDGFKSAADVEAIKAELSVYYQQDFAGEYKNRNDGDSINVQALIDQLSAQAIVAQYNYIQTNSNPLGEKHLLDKADGKASYHRMHARYHNNFRSFLERFGFYDIFLIEPENGVIVYSVFKELDFGTSLINGPYADTNFAQAFREAAQLPAGEYVLKDFAPYRPSYDAPASFIAAPVYDGEKMLGVLVYQMPLEVINEIMTQRNGMGKTGESYLVGPDLLMRSDSYLDPEKHSVSASFKNPETGSVKTKATERAFNGEAATDIITDYTGKPVLSAFSTLEIGSGIQWAILAEKDQSEAFAGVTALQNMLIFIAAIGIALIVGFAWYISRLLSAPILQLASTIQQVQEQGDFSIAIDNEYQDEIGDTSRAFNRLLDNLSTAINGTNLVLDEVSKGNFEQSITDEYPGQLGVLASGVNHAVADIKSANEEQARQSKLVEESAQKAQQTAEAAEAQAKEVLAIKEALDNSSTCTMIIDENSQVIYRNKAMTDFDHRLNNQADTLWASIADEVTRQANKGSKACDKELNHHQSIIRITTTAIHDNNGAYIGAIVEWADRTEEVAVEKEIDHIISSVEFLDVF